MLCQLDQVKQILDIAIAVKNSLEGDSGIIDHRDYDRKACSVIFGLLLLKNYDVFIQAGVLAAGEKEYDHFWIEVYLDNEAFVLDVTLSRLAENIKKELPEICFMPKEEAVEVYGYGPGRDYEWRREDCEKTLWQKVLAALDIHTPLDELLDEIDETLS
ncbi:hypothetical protein P378_18985 [Desulforamulus profundi]|uniref:Uncharacterized protein n=1 Tax=Desulforamulus profundi TaxID=1383067 RepID=A0A2C6MCH6_9FIRM|nr:hypothetical protein [Desulforamulus profundi]PHJ36993.1 hypothetical protein P378_18985 [Desulforamulus profundi]